MQQPANLHPNSQQRLQEPRHGECYGTKHERGYEPTSARACVPIPIPVDQPADRNEDQAKSAICAHRLPHPISRNSRTSRPIFPGEQFSIARIADGGILPFPSLMRCAAGAQPNAVNVKADQRTAAIGELGNFVGPDTDLIGPEHATTPAT